MKRLFLIKVWRLCMWACNTRSVPMSSPIRTIKHWAICKLDLEELQVKRSKLTSVLQ
jgi:hypothetical protein